MVHFPAFIHSRLKNVDPLSCRKVRAQFQKARVYCFNSKQMIGRNRDKCDFLEGFR
jgi:hypothetical protein